MTNLDDLWYLADEADRRAEQAYYRLRENYDEFLERETTRRVHRSRFRTLAERIRSAGVPYGAHTVVYRPPGELLLVRDTTANQWVLPGGAVDGGETLRETAERELDEEAGVEVEYEGLGYLARVEIRSEGYETWGVLPVFAAEAETYDPVVDDPDGEIVDAGWFGELPDDTRDRDDLREWRQWALE
jgi:8-oxo-dGTP diphosphatase